MKVFVITSLILHATAVGMLISPRKEGECPWCSMFSLLLNVGMLAWGCYILGAA